ncbi:hypothetical protein BDW42DRAFT_22317 [Aspergillus taichungensis]|uniref:Uncharacterized protein n=1 Tax=Aspergillus taichungensis TaxID=482145 RepID=A0A2J5HHA8_9EURO|nr:hypothetical protein BDW42DRAFT_22317 [Aspergillus taichungensis]
MVLSLVLSTGSSTSFPPTQLSYTFFLSLSAYFHIHSHCLTSHFSPLTSPLFSSRSLLRTDSLLSSNSNIIYCFRPRAVKTALPVPGRRSPDH